MAVNRDKPGPVEGQDIAQSVDMYNDWFMRFAPEAYRTTRVQTTKGCRGDAQSDDEPDRCGGGTAEGETLGVAVTADVHLSASGRGPPDRPCRRLREPGQGDGEGQQAAAANAAAGVGQRP